MLTIQYAKNPYFGDSAETNIILTVKFEEIEEELPFCANSYDPMPYGRELHANALRGEYGPITPYTPPPVVITTSPTAFPPAIVGGPYIQKLTAQGGTSPYTYSANELPAGLSVVNDEILGIPATGSAGDYSFVITATDANNKIGNTTVSLTIYAGNE